MNKNTPVTMAAAMAVAGILTLAVMTMALQHQAFAQAYNQGSSSDDKKQESKEVAVGGNGGSGGAGGAGGEGGQGGKNVADSGKNVGDDSDKCCCKDPGNTKIDQRANGGSANGGQGGNANGGGASA
ncbi:MAG TPA: hypothetical protein VEL11_02340 [Candidatus Bathyarchaeia archaeon]|nr:hypothetical protein [Candidatus Bathyarchaeia archaeon]